MAKKAFMEKKKLFIGKVNSEIKKWVMGCLVWSGAETWTSTQRD